MRGPSNKRFFSAPQLKRDPLDGAIVFQYSSLWHSMNA